MLYTIQTFNDWPINDGDSYRATLLNAGTPQVADPAFVTMVNADPVYAGSFAAAERNLAVLIEILDTSDAVDLAQDLKVILKRGTCGSLVVTYARDGQDYQLDATVVSLMPDGHYLNRYVCILQAGASAWRRVSAETVTWAADSTHLTKTITVSGMDETRLIAALTPTTAPAAGWAYQSLYQLVNAKGIGYGRRPWCITLDTAALVTAGKLETDGSDLRVTVNGGDAKRWLADANTDHTHVWFNLDLAPGYSLTLLTPIAATGDVGEITFKKNSNNLAALRKLPNEGILVHGTEWIQYAGKSLALYKLGVVARGACATTLQAHSAGNVFQYIQNVIYILTGNATAADPSTLDTAYDDDKPLFDLSASDNTQWVYTASTLFYDPNHPERPGSWSRTLRRAGNESDTYTFQQMAESGSPALGALMACWQRRGAWQSETATIAWGIACAGGIAEISVTGSKYRNSARWPTLAGLQKWIKSSWVRVWNETSPVNVSTWTAWTHNAQALTGNPVKVRLVQSGTIRALANAEAYFEGLTATVEFVSANLPAGTMQAEAGNSYLEIHLKSNTTEDEITLTYPMLVAKTLTVDGEDYTITYEGVNAHGALELDDPSRDAWIRLVPGENELEITGDVGDLSVALSWYPRVP